MGRATRQGPDASTNKAFFFVFFLIRGLAFSRVNTNWAKRRWNIIWRIWRRNKNEKRIWRRRRRSRGTNKNWKRKNRKLKNDNKKRRIGQRTDSIDWNMITTCITWQIIKTKKHKQTTNQMNNIFSGVGRRRTMRREQEKENWRMGRRRRRQRILVTWILIITRRIIIRILRINTRPHIQLFCTLFLMWRSIIILSIILLYLFLFIIIMLLLCLFVCLFIFTGEEMQQTSKHVHNSQMYCVLSFCLSCLIHLAISSPCLLLTSSYYPGLVCKMLFCLSVFVSVVQLCVFFFFSLSLFMALGLLLLDVLVGVADDNVVVVVVAVVNVCLLLCF